MGHIKEPQGVTLTVDKQVLTSETEERIKAFIKTSKEKNRLFIRKLNDTVK